jgi:hypothetical protein
MEVPSPTPSYAEPAVIELEPATEHISPAQMLNNPDFVGTPLSPCSAAFIIKGDLGGHETIFLVNIIKCLVATITFREENHKKVKKSLSDTTLYLKDKLTGFEDTFPVPPPGYIENNNHYPSLEVRKAGGVRVPAKWIKQLDNYTVARLCDTDIGNSSPSIFHVYATPHHSDKPIKPLPQWLIDMLTGNAASYTLVQDAAVDISDWGVAADLQRYHKAHVRLADAYKRVDVLSAQAKCYL